LKTDDKKQFILNANEEGIIVIQNGGKAAPQFQPEAEIRLDLQKKHIQVFLMFLFYVI
jgi:hypothetical protein